MRTIQLQFGDINCFVSGIPDHFTPPQAAKYALGKLSNNLGQMLKQAGNPVERIGNKRAPTIEQAINLNPVLNDPNKKESKG